MVGYWVAHGMLLGVKPACVRSDNTASRVTLLTGMKFSYCMKSFYWGYHEVRHTTEGTAVVIWRLGCTVSPLTMNSSVAPELCHTNTEGTTAGIGRPGCTASCSTCTQAPRETVLHLPGCRAVGVRCSFSDRNLHSRMPLVPTPARLKRVHACGQCHSSRVFTPLTGWNCKLRPNTGADHPVHALRDPRVWCTGHSLMEGGRY
jgi:hypothetical protein